MNYNMMCKKISLYVLLLVMLLHQYTVAEASEENKIPEGEILVIYSDGAEEKLIEDVKLIVELLTYHSFKVSFASASECSLIMKKFPYIICYKIEKYSDEFMENLVTYEKLSKNSKSDKNQGNILFIGSELLKEFYANTDQKEELLMADSKSAKLSYSFSDTSTKETLVKADNYMLMKNNLDYSAGTISIGEIEGYFCAKKGVVTHIPIVDLDNNLLKAAFIKEVAQWKWPYLGEPHIYAQYIVIDQVYPFEDANKMLEIVNYLIQQGDPFIISVMPIYVNGDYPTMQRFCEVLRYAQANDGMIIIHAPINQMLTFDKTKVWEYLKSAVEVYTNHGVYPMALEVPYNWMYHSETREIMSHFKMIFTTSTRDEYIQEDDTGNSNAIYKDGHQWVSTAIPLDDLGTSYVRTSSTAVTIDLSSDLQHIKNQILACEKSFVPLKSLWEVDLSYWSEEYTMSYQYPILKMNQEIIDTTFVPTEYEEDYKYSRNIAKRFSKDLTKGSGQLLILVGGTSSLFVLFIFIARYINRKKYFLD